MREILFRGQHRKKGEACTLSGKPLGSIWVYGGIFPAPEGGERAIIYQQEPEIEKFPVYADTVGQYTGMHDRNGVRIFEGDILALKDCHGQRTAAVYYSGAGACFAYGGNGLPDGRLSAAYWTEVIGNIYDNPEIIGHAPEEKA